MISSMASITSSSSATVRVEKATSEFLIGPDWTMNMDICDTINSNQMLAKDVVKAVKKRLQHKNPKVQLLALTLLETMVKNCGEYVHFQIAERNILQEMVKIVRKKTDMHVRDKILTLIGSWHEAFGGSAGRYPQYYLAYEDLRRSGVQFPRLAPDSAPVFTPPVTHPTSRNLQPSYGMPSSSMTRLDEAMAAEDKISLSSVNAMREVLDLLADMLQAVDPSDQTGVKDEVIIDLVEQCRSNQKKLMQMLATTGDEELLGQGLDLNDSLQAVLAKHDSIASGEGSPLPPQLTNFKPGVAEKNDPNVKPAEVTNPPATSNANPPPVLPTDRGPIDEEEEEEDDFALLARRHSKACVNSSNTESNGTPSGASSSTVMSNALVPTTLPPTQTKDQDIIDLLSITLSTSASTEENSQAPPASPMHSVPQEHMASASPEIAYSAAPYTGNHGLAFNNYVAPWAQPQPQAQPLFRSPQPQPQPRPQYTTASTSQNQYVPPNASQQFQGLPEAQQQPPQHRPPSQHVSQATTLQPSQLSQYPPPPWAATPGYFSNPSPVTRQPYAYSNPRPISPFMARPSQPEPINRETQFNSSPRSSGSGQKPFLPDNTGQKPFIPSYRLFEDLNVFGNADGRFKATSTASSSLSGSNNSSMVGGSK